MYRVICLSVQEEAKDAFKELLASVGCRSDWTWEQAMRLIVNDHRWVGYEWWFTV